MNKKILIRILLVLIILQFPVVIFLSNARHTTFDLKFYANEFKKYHPDGKDPGGVNGNWHWVTESGKNLWDIAQEYWLNSQ